MFKYKIWLLVNIIHCNYTHYSNYSNFNIIGINIEYSNEQNLE